MFSPASVEIEQEYNMATNYRGKIRSNLFHDSMDQQSEGRAFRKPPVMEDIRSGINPREFPNNFKLPISWEDFLYYIKWLPFKNEIYCRFRDDISWYASYGKENWDNQPPEVKGFLNRTVRTVVRMAAPKEEYIKYYGADEITQQYTVDTQRIANLLRHVKKGRERYDDAPEFDNFRSYYFPGMILSTWQASQNGNSVVGTYNKDPMAFGQVWNYYTLIEKGYAESILRTAGVWEEVRLIINGTDLGLF